jgi:hypothetical protein
MGLENEQPSPKALEDVHFLRAATPCLPVFLASLVAPLSVEHPTMRYAGVIRRSVLGPALLAVTSCALLAGPAEAASLQQVSNWTGGTIFPSDVTMYAYVPDKVATNPPILTLVHYC